MRTFAPVGTFIPLMLVGFLATPGLFKIVNPEYWLALREFGPPIAAIIRQTSELDSTIAELQSRISKGEREARRLSIEMTAKQASMKLADASAEDISKIAIIASTSIASLTSEVDQASLEAKSLQDKRVALETNRADLKKKIDAAATDSINIYLVVRALALGAIGAMMSIFAKYLAGPNRREPFVDEITMGRMWASIAMGGIVSVVVIGLFFTGFISIFSNATQSAGPTDFWKVTILCLLAGAFSDRLFQAAAGRMESYLQTGEIKQKVTTQAALLKKRPRAKTRTARGT